MACSEAAAFLQTAGAHYISNIFQPISYNSLTFAARQIANNLSPIAKNCLLLFLVVRIISVERTSNNLACAP